MRLVRSSSVVVVILIGSLGMSGCTGAALKRLLALGNPASIKCWSGNVVIYEGVSTGKVESSIQSDGYYFVDDKDKKLREVSGNCVITYQ